MQNMFGNLADWAPLSGSTVINLADLGPRTVYATIVAEDASVLVFPEGGSPVLLWSGQGPANLRFSVVGAAELQVRCAAETVASIAFRERQDMQSGWLDQPSFTRDEPTQAMAVPKEVRAMMDRLQMNMLRREAKMREEFEKRLGRD